MLGGTVLAGLFYILLGIVLLLAKVDIVCAGYTFMKPENCHSAMAQLTVSVINDTPEKIFLIGDARTTIDGYKRVMQQFDGAGRLPYVEIAAGQSVLFESTGDFMSGNGQGDSANAGVTLWVGKGCSKAGTCAWNADRTKGAVLEWNMKVQSRNRAEHSRQLSPT